MAKRSYTVAREGFLMNTYKKIGDVVVLEERQATYLIHAGQIKDPTKAVKTLAEHAAEAEAAFSAKTPAPPVAEPATPEPKSTTK